MTIEVGVDWCYCKILDIFNSMGSCSNVRSFLANKKKEILVQYFYFMIPRFSATKSYDMIGKSFNQDSSNDSVSTSAQINPCCCITAAHLVLISFTLYCL